MSNIEKEKKIIQQQKNKIRWKFGAVLAAAGIIILATVAVILFTQLNNNKEAETEVVTQVQNPANKIKSEITRLQDEVKKDAAVQGSDKTDVEAEITRLQDEVKKIEDAEKWNKSNAKKELKFILKNIDASVKMGGLMGEFRKHGIELTQSIWYTFFKELTNFVLNNRKRRLLVNSGQKSKVQKEQDFYDFVNFFDKGTEMSLPSEEERELLRSVSSKFETRNDLFRNLFRKYFRIKLEHSRNTERAKREILGTMLKHILSNRKVKEIDIKKWQRQF